MPRKARKLSSCGVYHIMIRGINRMTIFNDDADNLNFLLFSIFAQMKILSSWHTA